MVHLFWLPFTYDLSNTEQFGIYCEALPQLHQLLCDAKMAKKQKSLILKSDINLVSPKSVVFVDIREWGPGSWYSSLTSLPDRDTVTYVLRCEYQDFSGPKKNPRRKIKAFFPVLSIVFDVDNWFVSTYGHCTELKPDHVLLTKALLKQYKVNLTN